MIYTKDRKTAPLFDPLEHLGPKRRKLMDESWAGLFRKNILCELPVNRIAPFFHCWFWATNEGTVYGAGGLNSPADA